MLFGHDGFNQSLSTLRQILLNILSKLYLTYALVKEFHFSSQILLCFFRLSFNLFYYLFKLIIEIIKF